MHIHLSINNKMNNNSKNRLHSIKVFLTKQFVCLACFALVLTSQTAYADFRKALTAYQNRDGQTMLKEVQEAVDTKNDDGLILFLSILKQFNSWRPLLNGMEQNKLFDLLEKSAANSSLQAQYRLAVIPRTESTPQPKSTDSSEAFAIWQGVRRREEPKELEEEIARLESVANKGYAPAAYQLYVSNAQQYDLLRYQELSSKQHNALALDAAIIASKENALKWLTIAAESGNTRAAFFLGMKYINAAEGFYCGTPLCPPKDEALGWHWMQRAAKQVGEDDLLQGSFAYEMANLYKHGVAGNKPNMEQAYLWYLLSYNKYNFNDNSKIAAKALQEFGKTDAEIRKAQKTARLPTLYLASRNENNAKSPIFSYTEIPQINNPIQNLEVYANGEVRLLISDVQTFADAQNNSETWKKSVKNR